MSEFANTTDFLAHLRRLDVKLTVDEGRLGCNAPKGVLTTELKAELKARKEEIVEFLRKHAQPESLPPVQKLQHDGPLTPTSGQQRLWFLTQFDPDSAAYNLPTDGLRFSGRLNVQALENSLKEIIRRHEALRTSFINVDGSPKAVIREVVNWRMEIRSLAATAEPEREAELAKLAAEEARRVFDLTSAPLLHACLVELSSEEHALLLNLHHICSDGWSVGVLLDELVHLYKAMAVGQQSSLPELPVQYADYAQWHRQYVANGIMHSQVPYWKKHLGGQLTTLELPYDRPRPAVMTFAGRRARQRFPLELFRAVQRFSAAEGVTPFITLLTAFKIFLYRYSHQTDVIVGSATAGRSRPELERLIGFFLNNLALRTDLSGEPTVGEALSRVRETVLNGFSHQDVPLDHLTAILQTGRDLSRSPLFQVMFLLQNFPLRMPEIPGLTITRLELETSTSRYDLTLEGIEVDGEFQVHWEYNTDLFDSSTIERMQQHYMRLVESLVSSPEQRISQLQLLSDAEVQLVAAVREQSRGDYPKDICVHQWFETQAARTPQSTAVICGEDRLSYGELNSRAETLARQLRDLGVKPGVLVGISIDRSVLMPVALLGVLKAGGAYVPLDPQYPPDRIAFMLSDSGAAVLITEEHLLSSLPANRPNTICLERGPSPMAATQSESFSSTGNPEDLAYVIYTSGSTGKPKGVEITHRSLVNFLASMRHTPGMTEKDCLVAVTTLSFDIAGLEMYLPLITGACVAIATRTQAAEGAALARLLKQVDATVMQATPVTWRMLLESGWQPDATLKILCGGEALPRELANKLIASGGEVYNLYGPTETTIWSSVHRVDSRSGSVPIGTAIANTQLYVLDETLQPVPTGVSGELYIGGDGLARGYLNRPELTTEKFVPNPFQSQERLYRTGDLVRILPDGNIEYLARMDNQIKLRGFRIELGEIEAALEQQPGIRQAVVIVREDSPGDQRLTAYVLASQDKAVGDSRTWREALQSKLPDYMVPSAFVILDAFPLTPNKKVDRKALPAPKTETSATAASAPPRTDSEAKVAAIWQELLRTGRVGVNDNFFDLGGHSLLVAQLQTRLRQQFNFEISLVELFQRPTVAAIAMLLDKQRIASSATAGR